MLALVGADFELSSSFSIVVSLNDISLSLMMYEHILVSRKGYDLWRTWERGRKSEVDRP